MIELFRLNWKMRDEWFRWCLDVPQVELDAPRLDGAGSILRTLFHIIDVEQYWIRRFAYGTDHRYAFAEHADLDSLQALSRRLRPFVEETVKGWTPERDRDTRIVRNEDGTESELVFGDVLRWLVQHEAHHAGQLSVWSRELGLDPVPLACAWPAGGRNRARGAGPGK
jgi:Uncharacterized protein conserved in bacteria